MTSPAAKSTSGGSDSGGHRSNLRWFALFALTGINLLNYIDRYIFSALLPAIKDDLKFTDTELGLLGSAFILAYLFISPVFGFLGDRGGRSRVMAGGVALWSAATAFSGLATTFTGQLVTRVFVGVGESAYSVIAPTVIADHFTKATRGKTFAIYSGAIPVGSALGYVLGGWLEPILGWRHSFFVVGVPGVLLAALLFFMKDPPRGQQDAEHSSESGASLLETYRALFKNGGFLFTVLGYAAYTFVVGGMAFWMPSYIVRYFNVGLDKGNLVFGGVTVVGGFVGTLLGGWWADRIERKSGNGYLKISVFSMIFAAPLFWFTLTRTDFKDFAAALFVMEVALFMCISPLDVACLNYVRPGLRSTAMALNIFLIHFLGDGISRALMGMVSDASDLRTAIAYLPWVLALAGVLWSVGVVVFWQPLHWPKRGLRLPRYQAHRGYRPSALVTENTLAAFREARRAGAEMSECDVQMTKDRHVVVFHDFDLKRIANAPDLVADLTLSELRAKFPQVATLRELLKDPESPRLINVELKARELIGRSGFEAEVAKVVHEADASERVLFSSFNPFALRRLSKVAPEIPRALLVTEGDYKENKAYLRKMWLGFWARPHLLHLEQSMITPERLAAWTERGIPVAVWTVNDRATADRLLGYGVRSVISDTQFK